MPTSQLSAAVEAAHQVAQDRGEIGYEDSDTGLFVFTRATLLGNGRCCDSGCRHCPYT